MHRNSISQEAKKDERKTVVLTGGTGFLGSRLSSRLLETDYRVIFIVRPKDNISVRKRVEKAITNKAKTRGSYICIPGDITKDECGIKKNDLALIKEKNPTAIWHLAALISFRDRHLEESKQINREGTKNILHLADELTAHLFHVSTAYVHGKDKGESREEFLNNNHGFNNPYELSKYQAEHAIKKWGQEHENFNYTIFRPGILIDINNDPSSDFGFYSFIKSFRQIKHAASKLVHKYPVLRVVGLFRDNDDFLHIPVFFPLVEENPINLIPVSVATKWMVGISNSSEKNRRIFHITDPKPPTAKKIFSAVENALKIRAKTIPANPTIFSVYMRILSVLGIFMPTIKRVQKTLSYYSFYLKETVKHDVTNTKSVLGQETVDDFNNLPGNYLQLAAESYLKVE